MNPTHNMRYPLSTFSLSLCFFTLCPLCLCGSFAAEKKAEPRITYQEHVVPILREHCFSCHNQEKKRAGLALDNFNGLMEGGGSGKVVEPGDPEKSRLWLVVNHQEEPFMPPSPDKLPDAKLDVIRKWIEGGAPENVGSKVMVTANKPKFDFSLSSATVGKPEGPPPMPGLINLVPAVNTDQTTAITALASSPWAPLVAVGGQKQVLLYHSDTMELLGVLPFPEGVPHVLKFSRNGSLLLAGGGHAAKSGKVVVWNVQTGERLFTVGDEYDCVLAADISSDQSKIALGGPGKVVRIYSTKDGSLLHEIKKHTDWVTALEFSPDSVLIATGDRNGGLFVWEAYTAREYFTLKGHSAAITDVSWRGDSNVVATSSEDASIRLWEMENGNQIKSWGAHGGGTASVTFAHDGRLVSAGRDRVVKIWDQDGKQQKTFEAFADLALVARFTHDGGNVIAGDWTGQIKVWAAADGKLAGNLSPNPPTLAEMMDAAQKRLASQQAAHKQLAAAANASQEAAKAAAEKAAADTAAADKAAADLAASQARVEKLQAALRVAQQDKSESAGGGQ